MTPLEICLALVLDRIVKFHRHPANWQWHQRWRDWLQRQGLMQAGSAWLSVFVLLAPPVLLVLWLDALLMGWPGSLLAVLVLAHAMGARDLYSISDRYVDALRRGDEQGLRDGAEELGVDPAAGSIEFELGLSRAVLHQYLTPIFWALLFGPAGALLIRMCAGWIREQDPGMPRSADPMRTLLGLLDWLPVRFGLLLLAVCGNFESAWKAWRPAASGGMQLHDDNLRQLDSVCLAAAGLSSPALVTSADAVRAVRGLLLRAMVLAFALLLSFAIFV